MNVKNRRISADQTGFILPVVIFGLALAAMAATYFVGRFSGTGSREFMAERFRAEHLGTVLSGFEWGKNRLLRPDNPALAHVWTEAYEENVLAEIDGRSVKIRIEDLGLSGLPGGGGGGGGGSCLEGKVRTKSAGAKEAVNVDIGDVDRDGIVSHTETFVLDGTKKVFRLAHWPVHRILAVQKNGTAYQKKFYSCQLKNGWFSVKDKAVGGVITVAYEYSTDLDLLTSNASVEAGQKNALYVNTGNFQFTETFPFSVNGHTRDAAFGDFDNDGDLDVAFAYANAPVRVFVNDGSGGFDGGTNVDTVSRDSSAIVWTDLDFDGKPELVVANISGNESRIYKFQNYVSGSPVFTVFWNQIVGPNTISVDAGDFDGDGDADLLFADQAGKTYVYENVFALGKRVFVMDAASHRLKLLDSYDLYPVDEVGVPGGAVSFDNASGLALDSSYIYVADSGNSEVKILAKDTLKPQATLSGGFMAADAASAVGMWVNSIVPTSVAADATHVYITDAVNGNLIRLAKTGTASVVTTLAAMAITGLSTAQDVKFYKTSIAVSVKGTGQIKIYDKTSLKYVGDSYVTSAMGVATDGNYLYGIDSTADQVMRFQFNPPAIVASAAEYYALDTTAGVGNFTDPYTAATIASTGLQDPTYISYGNGEIFITNKTVNTVEKWDAATMTPLWRNNADVASPTGIVADDGPAPALKMREWTSSVDFNVRYAEWADVDKDGDLDIVIVGLGSSSGGKPAHAVLRNDGYTADAPVFTRTWGEDVDKENAGFAIGDVDGDGQDDMLMARTNQTAATGPALSLYKGTGGGSYSAECDSSLQTDADYKNFSASKVRLADLNNDGIKDVVVTARDTAAFSDETAGFGIYSKGTEGQDVTRLTATYIENSAQVSVEALFRVDSAGRVLDVFAVKVN